MDSPSQASIQKLMLSQKSIILNKNSPLQLPQYKIAVEETKLLMRKSQFRLDQMTFLSGKSELNADQFKQGNFRQAITQYLRSTRNNISQSILEEDRLLQIEKSLKSNLTQFDSMKKLRIKRQSLASLSHIKSERVQIGPKQNGSLDQQSDYFLRVQTQNNENSLNENSSMNHHRLEKILTQTSEVVEALLPDIKQIKKQDKIEGEHWIQLTKNYNRDLDFNTGEWQYGSKFQQVKNDLKDIQEEANLPEYFKFCLINTKENLRNANRVNQEIKETRFLWFQIQKQNKVKFLNHQPNKYQIQIYFHNKINYKLGEPLDDETIRLRLEKILKKFQRIKQNQFLSQKNGKGWKLNQSSKKKNLNQEEEEYELLKENLGLVKSESTKTEMKKRFMMLDQQRKLDNKLENLSKQLHMSNSNENIRKQIITQYKSNALFVDCLDQDEKEFLKQLGIFDDACKQAQLNILDVKEKIKIAKQEIQLSHKTNYKNKSINEAFKII